jgi:hypothetical protein
MIVYCRNSGRRLFFRNIAASFVKADGLAAGKEF